MRVRCFMRDATTRDLICCLRMSEYQPFLIDAVPVFPLIHAFRLVCRSTLCLSPLILPLGHHGMFLCSPQPDFTHGP